MALPKRRVTLFTIFGLCAIPFVALQVFRLETASGQRRLRRTSTNVANYEPQKVLPPFEAIEKPRAAPKSEADKRLGGRDLVLGVSLRGQARAYPINQLTGPSREIFNDSMGGQAIAATW